MSDIPVAAIAAPSSTVIRRTVEQPSSSLSGDVGFLSGFAEWFSRNFFSTILIIILVMLLIIGMVLYYKLRQKKIEEEEDVFHKNYKRVVKACKLQNDSNHYRKNNFLVYAISTGVYIALVFFGLVKFPALVGALFAVVCVPIALFVSFIGVQVNPFNKSSSVYAMDGNESIFLGFYLGEAKDAGGFLNFLLWKNRKHMVRKDSFVVKIPVNRDYVIREQVLDKKTKKPKVVEKKVSLPSGLGSVVVKGQHIIHIKCAGIELQNLYYFPIFRDSKGAITDNRFVIYDSQKNGALIDMLYEQTAAFGEAMRQAVNLNPNARYLLKTGGDSIDRPVGGGFPFPMGGYNTPFNPGDKRP